jgi:hypothetical protein
MAPKKPAEKHQNFGLHFLIKKMPHAEHHAESLGDFKSGATSWCRCHNWLNRYWNCGLPSNAPGISPIWKNTNYNLHAPV